VLDPSSDSEGRSEPPEESVEQWFSLAPTTHGGNEDVSELPNKKVGGPSRKLDRAEVCPQDDDLDSNELEERLITKRHLSKRRRDVDDLPRLKKKLKC
jgi:hypothetical protein